MTFTHIEPKGRGGDFYFITSHNTFFRCWRTGLMMIMTGLMMCFTGKAKYMITADQVSMREDNEPATEAPAA